MLFSNNLFYSFFTTFYLAFFLCFFLFYTRYFLLLLNISALLLSFFLFYQPDMQNNMYSTQLN